MWIRVDCCADRLSGTKVQVGSYECGTLSSTTEQTVQCDGALGTEVKLVGASGQYLTLCEVKVWGSHIGPTAVPTPAPTPGEPSRLVLHD